MSLKELKADFIPKLGEIEFFASKRVLTDILSGNLVTRFKGKGMEFKGYRSYTPYDDASRIDWRATLRARKTLIREYDVEKSYYVFFLLDVSESMLFASTDKLKCEYAAELVSSLMFAVLNTGAGAGFGMASDDYHKIIVPNLGQKQYYLFKKEVINVANYGGGPFDLERAFKLMLSYLPEKALIVIVSDFINITGNWFKYLQILSQTFEVIGIMVRDPRDRELPKNIGQFLLEDPYSEERLQIDVDQYRQLYHQHVLDEEKKLQRKFTLTKSDFLILTTDIPFNEPLLKFFKKRGLKWS